MAGKFAVETGSEELAPSPRIGNVRWTICAMLFVATSIN